MKIPEVIFVKHCPDLAPERKVFLEKHLKERVSIKDVRWIEDYNHDHKVKPSIWSKIDK
jgi:hypothetical protein